MAQIQVQQKVVGQLRQRRYSATTHLEICVFLTGFMYVNYMFILLMKIKRLRIYLFPILSIYNGINLDESYAYTSLIIQNGRRFREDQFR